MFWGLGLWGYITSYKGISTNFVLREPSSIKKYVIVSLISKMFFISLLCPYTNKRVLKCKYAKFDKYVLFFCCNLSMTAHFLLKTGLK